MIVKHQIEFPLDEDLNFPVKILLVDDRIENLISLESLLRKEGEDITYITANSGSEALKISLKEELALILLDVQMPDMNGYEVARFLRNNSKTKNIPIIFVTAIDQDAGRMVEGFEAGAIDFLFKPLHPYITKAKVSAFLDLYKHKKELEKAHQYVLKANVELEERVKERTKELIKINNDLDNFIYTASHDLKAPISNIEGLMYSFYEVLSDESQKSEEVSEIRRMIDESIQRFKNTLIDLTEVAKAQSEIASDNSKVDLSEMLCEVKLSIKELIDEMGAEIKEDFTRLPIISFSRKNLRSIIYNLVSNAVKYSSPDRKPKIEITSYKVDDCTILAVSDNGLGIREEDKEKVFGMFKRLHTHVEGTGIGMSIVKKIVENNGGKIELTSELGEGSVFKVFLKQ
jgi:signal transduction histidine kinase